MTVADRDLARALPPGLRPSALPGWAYCRGTWTEGGYRVLLPLFDERGEMVSIHARNLRADTQPKSAVPAGLEIIGTVFADAAGLLMLRDGVLRGRLWIAEGAPDFIDAATSWGDAADPAPAILGIVSGSWSRSLAARVPNGAEVAIASHHDKTGEAFAAGIAATLAGRVKLSRWIPLRGPEP